MSTALLESPLSLSKPALRSRAAGGPGLTLEERLEAAWRGAQAEGVAECPVCRARMQPEGEPQGQGRPVRCLDCGSTLS
jgi:hypothetical protein